MDENNSRSESYLSNIYEHVSVTVRESVTVRYESYVIILPKTQKKVTCYNRS